MTTPTATLTVTLVDGTQVVVPDSLEQITPYVLQEQGDWFEDEIKYLRRLVQPGQTVLDIGANVGVYALCLARKVGPTGQVWAFEPTSASADLLEASINANGTTWLHLQRQALSDPQGPGKEVPLTTLDACLDEFSWKQVDLLRIGAGGGEEAIFAGGQGFFRNLSPLVMFSVKAGGELRLELVERFGALGYRCFRLVPGLDALMPFDPAAGVDGYILNLFAAKTDRAEALAKKGWLVNAAEPEPPEAAQLERYHWCRTLMELPYARELANSWQQEQVNRQAAGAAEDPLALWAFAHDRSQPVDRRLGALQRGYQLLQDTCAVDNSLARWASRARLALELGERQQALQATGNLLPALQTGTEPELNKPFLPPNPTYDRIDPAGRPAAWLEAAALENDEVLCAFSGFFNGQASLPRLERIAALGYASPAAQQRLQLLLRRFPPRIEANPAMERPDPEQITCSRDAWARIRQGDVVGAREILAKAMAMGDCCSEALLYMGRTLLATGEGDRAVNLLQRAVELDPQKPTILLELALALKRLGQHREAQAVAEQTVWLYGFLLASRPTSASDLNNLAITHDELDQPEQALACLEQALELDPQLENALRRKASILARSPDGHAEALATWRRLFNSAPKDVGVTTNIARLLHIFGETPEARELLERALMLSPRDLSVYQLLAWNTSISGPGAMADHLRHLHNYWQIVREDECHDSSLTQPAYSLPSRKQKLRIGILSAEVGTHVVGLFLEPLFTHYDRDRIQLEVIQAREHSSSFANLLRAKADAVLSVEKLGTDEARRRIRARGYHLIVETSGFTENSAIHLLARRCAPVQCHYIGFHASTGLDTIDWFIGDELTAAPDLADQFVEKLWRLPRPWLACHRHPDLPSAGSMVTGLRPVLGSFNQFGKIRDETLAFWACALRRISHALLHIKSFTTDAEAPRHRIRSRLAQLGVDPGRITFLPPSPSARASLEMYRHIDLALDTTPWSGATTSFDALSMGVPLAAIQGDCTASRMSSSILRAIGHDDWCARTPETFADVVQQFCEDLPRLRRNRQSLREQVLASRLFDGADLAHHLQRAFHEMVDKAATRTETKFKGISQ